MRSFAGTVLFAALAAGACGQSAPSTAAPADAAGPPVKFEIADIHPSPARRFSFFDGGFLVNGRYLLRQATLADLIATAYGLKDSSFVHGGPSWLEWDRWDVIARTPPGTTEEQARMMLQGLLKDRFSLVVHSGEGPVPSYLLTALKDQPSSSLKSSTGSGDAECPTDPPPATPPPPGTIASAVHHCHNVTMGRLAELLPTMAPAYADKPVVDRTGLKGAFDFDLHWTGRGNLERAGADGISLFDALEKQLGLKLAPGTSNQLVFLVDSANETPTPNAPDLAKIMPPLPPPKFEVATIKPSAPGERGGGGIHRDGLSFHGVPLKFLIAFAWDVNGNDVDKELVGAPKWLASDMIDIDAKVATEDMVEGGSTMQGIPPIPIEDLRELVKQLLIDRFEIKMHTENQPQDAYTLVSINPKMTKANPAERTRCAEGPGPDGNDPRLGHPILNMLVTCQNVSMEQAGKLFPTFAAWYLHYPVEDKTGLAGGWDFTLSWSSGDHMPEFQGGQGSPNAQSETAADPNGALSFYDAVNKELGLRLVKEKRPEPVVVIDHIDEQPTPN